MKVTIEIVDLPGDKCAVKCNPPIRTLSESWKLLKEKSNLSTHYAIAAMGAIAQLSKSMNPRILQSPEAEFLRKKGLL